MPDGGHADYEAMLERARRMRHRLERTQEDLSGLEATGTASSGLVTATVASDNTLVALAIDSSVIDPDDPESLSELIREAVNEAQRKLAGQRGEKVAGLAQGFEGLLAGLRKPEGGVVPMTATRRRERPDGPPPEDG